jgi:four helix bundle protein
MENENALKRDIQARAYQFACRIVKLKEHLVRQKGTCRMVAGQLLRCGTSVGANLEEADEAQSKKDFISKCNIALKEAREAHYWLRLLADCNLVPVNQLARSKANQISWSPSSLQLSKKRVRTRDSNSNHSRSAGRPLSGILHSPFSILHFLHLIPHGRSPMQRQRIGRRVSPAVRDREMNVGDAEALCHVFRSATQ